MKGLLMCLFIAPCLALANEDSVLTWDAVSNAAEYHVQRKAEDCTLPDGAPWIDLNMVPHPTTTYTDPQVAEGLIVCYRVSASAAGRQAESDWSNRAEKTVPFVKRGAPANLIVN